MYHSFVNRVFAVHKRSSGKGRAWQGACMAGVCMERAACVAGWHGWRWVGGGMSGCACQERWPLLRTVRILLECILVTARNEVGARLCFHRGVWFCSPGGGGCLPQCTLGYPTPLEQTSPGNRHPPPESRHPTPGSRHPPGADTPRSRHPIPEQTPPLGADTPHRHPWEQTRPGSRHPSGSRHPPGWYGQCVGGTHPTGMQSCSYFILDYLN